MIEKIKNKFFLWLEEVLPYEEYTIIRSKYYWLTTPTEWKNKYELPYFLSKKSKTKERYCIIRIQSPQYALFAAGMQYIFMYDWAIKQGYIPLLDIEHGYNFQRYMLGEDNLWEYCFEQPISVKEALRKGWVFVETIDVGSKYCSETCIDINGKKEDHFIHVIENGWREYYKKVNQYIKKTWVLKNSFLVECQNEYNNVANKNGKVLGVFLRENFSRDAEKYRVNNIAKQVYQNHPMTMGTRDIVDVVRTYIKKWNCSKVFLATMMQDSVDLFVGEFGDKVSYIKRNRRDFATVMNETNIAWDMTNQEMRDYHKKTGQERSIYESTCAYAKEVWILSQCDCLIAAKSSGAAVALALNGGQYEDIVILPDYNEIERY